MKLILTLSALICVTYSRVASYNTSSNLKISNRAGAQLQIINMYDYVDQAGNFFGTISYKPYLREYNFDNKVTSVVVTGIWLMYDDANYNTNNVKGASYWLYGDNYGTNVPSDFDNMASSVRYAGSPDNWKLDYLNLYLNEYFIGGEDKTKVDQPQLNYNDQTRSIVVSGCSAWTLYSDANYGGSCTCVFPSDSIICLPGFYSTEESLGSLSSTISSVRKGCYCDTKDFPENYQSEDQQNFNL